MTGYELYAGVCRLLGCYEFIEDGDSVKKQAFLSAANQICEDLGIKALDGLSQKIEAEAKFTEALTYGSAMLFAMSLKDSGCAKMYSVLYASKRKSVLCTADARGDVLPVAESGGV